MSASSALSFYKVEKGNLARALLGFSPKARVASAYVGRNGDDIFIGLSGRLGPTNLALASPPKVESMQPLTCLSEIVPLREAGYTPTKLTFLVKPSEVTLLCETLRRSGAGVLCTALLDDGMVAVRSREVVGPTIAYRYAGYISVTDNFFVAAGYQADEIPAPALRVFFASPGGWRAFGTPVWRFAASCVLMPSEGGTSSLSAFPKKHALRPRLQAYERRQPASLWLLSPDDRSLQDFMAFGGDRRLTKFEVFGTPGGHYLRTSSGLPSAWTGHAQAFWEIYPSLFAPVGYRLWPFFSAESDGVEGIPAEIVQELFGLSAAELVVLTGTTEIVAARLRKAAFVGLRSLVNYRPAALSIGARIKPVWPFELPEAGLPDSVLTEPEMPEFRKKRFASESDEKPPERKSAQPPERVAVPVPILACVRVTDPEIAELKADLGEAATAFTEKKRAAWLALSSAMLANGRIVDAAHCAVRGGGQLPALSMAELGRCLEQGVSSAEDAVRVVYSITKKTVSRFGPRLVAWLADQENQLPARLLWLGYKHLAEVTDDQVLLEHGREAITSRLLRQGLDRQIDLPSFVQPERFSVAPVRDVVYDLFAKTGALGCTQLYTDLSFAVAAALCGEASLAARYGSVLEAVESTPANQWLCSAFAERLRLSLSTRRSYNPLSADTLRKFMSLNAVTVGAVAEFLTNSTALDPFGLAGRIWNTYSLPWLNSVFSDEVPLDDAVLDAIGRIKSRVWGSAELGGLHNFLVVSLTISGGLQQSTALSLVSLIRQLYSDGATFSSLLCLRAALLAGRYGEERVAEDLANMAVITVSRGDSDSGSLCVSDTYYTAVRQLGRWGMDEAKQTLLRCGGVVSRRFVGKHSWEDLVEQPLTAYNALAIAVAIRHLSHDRSRAKQFVKIAKQAAGLQLPLANRLLLIAALLPVLSGSGYKLALRLVAETQPLVSLGSAHHQVSPQGMFLVNRLVRYCLGCDTDPDNEWLVEDEKDFRVQLFSRL